jgi:hypothetical protein
MWPSANEPMTSQTASGTGAMRIFSVNAIHGQPDMSNQGKAHHQGRSPQVAWSWGRAACKAVGLMAESQSFPTHEALASCTCGLN